MNDIIQFFNRLLADPGLTLIFIFIVLASKFLMAPFARFFSKNLLDSGNDRYNAKNEANESTKKDSGKLKTNNDEILKSQILEVILNESGKEYFDAYKSKIEKEIELKQNRLTNSVVSDIIIDEKIEETITNSIKNTIEETINKLVHDNEHFDVLEKETLERLTLVKVSSFLEHLEKEYDATRSTKALMSNMFIFVNIIYFFGLMYFLISGQAINTTPTLYLAISLSYIGLGAFVVYMIKFCNARSLTLLSLREDFIKRDKISSMANKIVDIGTNEHHIALLQIINSSIATKEQKVNHPYEMLLYGIKDSNIMFKGGKFEIKKESPAK